MKKVGEKMEFLAAVLVLTAGMMILAIVRATSEVEAKEAKIVESMPIPEKHEAPEIEKEAEPEEDELDNLWADDRLLIARVVMAEAGTEAFVGKVAVAATILNRAELREMDIDAVIYEANQYAAPYFGTIPEEVYEAVDYAVENRDLFPKNMFFFRTHHYHRMPFAEDYTVIGHHYFSLDNRY